MIVCRTKECQRIFQNLGKEVYFLGFTSKNYYDASIEKDFSQFFHLAGNSLQKGTSTIIGMWKENPEFPRLTILKHGYIDPDLINLSWIPNYVSVEELCLLMNQSGVHLCPSETEGFGHYIMEAMSTGAVVITTDAPPDE